MVKDIPESVEQSIIGPLREFTFRPLKSNSVSGSVKTRRLALCFDVANELRSDVIELMKFMKALSMQNWDVRCRDDWGPGRPASRSTRTLRSP